MFSFCVNHLGHSYKKDFALEKWKAPKKLQNTLFFFNK